MYYLAIDIGASSGRHIIGSYENGRLTIEEMYRFPNGMKKNGDGTLVWDSDALFGYVKAGIADPRGKGYCPDAQSRELLLEATKQLVEYGIEIIPDELGVKETLRKAVQYIKWRDKVLDLVLRLESDEVESYANS